MKLGSGSSFLIRSPQFHPAGSIYPAGYSNFQHKSYNSISVIAIMPSFESKRPFWKGKANKEEFESHNDSDASSIKSGTSQVEGEKKPGFFKKTWKHCKRPG